MQICAFDQTGALVFADHANKHQDYQCVECHQVIRLRRGIHRKAHYYHAQPNRICRQHGKGMPHLMLQQYLKNLLPEGEVELECPFKEIGRIADVAWHPMRLIYEIQCSPISAEEVKGRNDSYASIGYRVIWIFHDERYNQSRLSAAENFLCEHPHYYSNMDAEGNGMIYDQFSMTADRKRVRRLPILAIDASSPKWMDKHQMKSAKKLLPGLHKRLKKLPLFFSGDAIDCGLHAAENMEDYTDDQRESSLKMKELLVLEKRASMLGLLVIPKNLFYKFLVSPYQAVLKLLLERACR